MFDRLAITAEVYGLRLRNTLTLLIQLAGLGALLFGAVMLFYPAAAGMGIPVGALPIDRAVAVYDSVGVHWLVWMVAGAVAVWLSTR
jgi:hypothetical protein